LAIFYHWQRLHGPLKGKTSSQIDAAICDKTPLQEEVVKLYDVSKEHIQNTNYFFETQLRKLKGCL